MEIGPIKISENFYVTNYFVSYLLAIGTIVIIAYLTLQKNSNQLDAISYWIFTILLSISIILNVYQAAKYSKNWEEQSKIKLKHSQLDLRLTELTILKMEGELLNRPKSKKKSL